jgi:hypothetical protein
MKKLTRIAAIAVFAGVFWSLSGCATLFAHKNPEVNVASDPQGAKVYVNNELLGTTPVKLNLKNNKDYVIEFRKDGYQSKTYLLGKHVGVGWVILDVIFGLVPVVVDAVTGEWYELDNDHVNMALER